MYFYPRPPRGGRLWTVSSAYNDSVISIHALREEGDLQQSEQKNLNEISIHALREEGDLYAEMRRNYEQLFLSTPSARRATC